MKLAGYQIEAIVGEQASREQKKAKIEYDKAKNSNGLVAKAKAIHKKLISIPLNVRTDIHYSLDNVSFKKILNILVSKNKPEIKGFDRYEFRRKVIITAADCTTMKELTTKLNVKF